MENRLDADKKNSSKNQPNIRDNRRYGEKTHFEFSDIKQEDDESNLNEFSDIAENNKTKYIRTPVFDVIIDGYRDTFQFILDSEFVTDDREPLEVIRFKKTQLNYLNPLKRWLINVIRHWKFYSWVI